MSIPGCMERVSVREKGQTAEVFTVTRTVDAGPPEKIRRTVTKVERCHSLRIGSFCLLP